jgi:hypothetical protein
MTAELVALSRAAGDTVNFLNLDARIKFVDAVATAPSISKVAEPYRSWIIDSFSIPTDARRLSLRERIARSD